MKDERKNFVILLNGEPYRGEIDAENSTVLCCDGAYSWAKNRVRIDENLGDFDSLSEVPSPLPSQRFPAEKNETDGELAVDRALSLGATDIDFYGGEGKRADHFLGNLHLLYKAKKLGVNARLIGNEAEFTLCGEGEQQFPCKVGQTFSLLPFGGDAHIMELKGVKYAADDLLLSYGSTRGVSNLTKEEKFSFRVEKGYVLVVINEEVV